MEGKIAMSYGTLVNNNDRLEGLILPRSRYYILDLVTYEGKFMLNVPNPLKLEPLPGYPDVTFIVNGRYVNRIDLISMKFYQTPKYWWVLARYNDLSNPFRVSNNTILKIPSYFVLVSNNIVRS